MTTQLHQQIVAIAQNDPAIRVSELVLVNLITKRLDKAPHTFLGFYRQYPDGAPIVQIGLALMIGPEPTGRYTFRPLKLNPGRLTDARQELIEHTASSMAKHGVLV